MNKLNSKINIEKKLFYIIISLLSMLIVFYTVYFLDSIIIGTSAYNHIKDKDEYTRLMNGYITGKIASYFTNWALVIGYLAYVLLARRKLEIGYIFVLVWTIVFIAITVSPHFLNGSHDDSIKLVTGIFVSIFAGLVCLANLYIAWSIKLKRMTARRNIFREKRRTNG